MVLIIPQSPSVKSHTQYKTIGIDRYETIWIEIYANIYYRNICRIEIHEYIIHIIEIYE